MYRTFSSSTSKRVAARSFPAAWSWADNLFFVRVNRENASLVCSFHKSPMRNRSPRLPSVSRFAQSMMIVHIPRCQTAGAHSIDWEAAKPCSLTPLRISSNWRETISGFWIAKSLKSVRTAGAEIREENFSGRESANLHRPLACKNDGTISNSR